MTSIPEFPLTLPLSGTPVFPNSAIWTFLSLPITCALVAAYLDYAAWYALGPGGPPHSFKGWALVHRLGLRRKRNLTDTSVFDTIIKSRPQEGQSYLKLQVTPSTSGATARPMFDDLPVRRGIRPQMSRWVAPVRQLSEQASDHLKKRLYDGIASFGAANSKYLIVGPSAMERGHGPRPNALLLRSDLPLDACNSTRLCACDTQRSCELYHVHCTDGSVHCILSAADAQALVARGWAELFLLGGVPNAFPGLPVTYVMLYAPRDEGELQVHTTVMRAAVAYALGGTAKLRM